jgi:glycosyltransferase involved in cell wall biosynthesis
VRVLIVDTWYRPVLDQIYAAGPELRDASYDVQWRALMATFFGTADSYSHYLGELGHEAHELVVNCGPLQAAWSREHRRSRPFAGRLRRRRGRDDLLLAQAAELAPDVVYVQDPAYFPRATLDRLRGRARLLVGQVASALPGYEQLAAFDLVLSSMPRLLEDLSSRGVESRYFRIGFDPRVPARLQAMSDGVRGDAVFVGSLGRGPHAVGNELLARAAERVPIEFWGTGAGEWPEGSPIRTAYRGPAWGLDMYRVLAGAKIALNRHHELAGEYANNMRLYEATGVGTLLLTESKRNLPELFEPGREVVAYDSVDDLVEKVAYYLEHDEERSEIARSGQERTLREHTYAQRMSELAELLAERLA